MDTMPARAFAKLRRMASNPRGIRGELQFLRDGIAAVETEQRIHMVGANWIFRPNLPIAVAFEVAKWKRGHVAQFLSEYRVLFASRKVGQAEISAFLQTQGVEANFVPDYFVWGRRNPPNWVQGRFSKVQNFGRIEDGFLRSIGPGLYHEKPHSLVVDRRGIYFDATRTSDLRELITASGNLGPVEQAAASDGVALFRLMRLTKYYPTLPPAPEDCVSSRITDARDSGKVASIILVIGQMEKDASLAFGVRGRGGASNSALLSRALTENPNSTILYKRHPDEMIEAQSLGLNEADQARIEELAPTSSLHDALRVADHVYTLTSLSGFEALIMGKTVTVLGQPFYADWGLEANVRSGGFRRAETFESRTLEQVFHAAYLNYPRYLHPDSQQRSHFFDLASYFFVERFCYGQVLGLHEDQLPRALSNYMQRLSLPLRTLLRLQDFEFPGDAGPDDLADLLEEATLTDVPQLGRLLVAASSYDALVRLSETTVRLMERDWESLKTRPEQIRILFEAYAFQQRSSNGRVLPNMTDLGSDLANLAMESSDYHRALQSYVETQSNNLNYAEITRLVTVMESQNAPSNLLRKIVAVLQNRPSRSERRADLRHALTDRTIRLYRRSLDARFPEPEALFLNSALEAIARKDTVGVNSAFGRLRASLVDEKAIAMSSKDEDIDFLNSALDVAATADPKAASSAASRLRDMIGPDEKGFYMTRLPGKHRSWIIPRLGHVYEVYHYFLKLGKVAEADAILDFLFGGGRLNESLTNMKHQLTLTRHASLAKHDAYIETYLKAPEDVQEQIKTRMSFARALKGVGELESARAELRRIRRAGGKPRQIMGVQSELDRLEFVIRTDEILETYPQPKLPRGVIILASQTCYNTLAMIVPALLALRKQGYAVVNLMEGMNTHAPTGVDFIDQFAGSLSTRLRDIKISNEWEVNWEERYVASQGVNFYQGFYERLSTQHRNFFVDINSPMIRQDFDGQLMRSDLALTLCRRIHTEIVGRGLDVAILSGNSHVTPFSIFRDYARAVDDPKLSFINCNVAYESYFSNLGSKLAHTMCVTDMTLHKNRRAPFMATEDGFNNWYAKNKNDPEFQKRADALIKVNRNSSASTDSADRLGEDLAQMRAEGKTIIACFGKVPVDLNVPYDGGPAHVDMSDWITHTVDIAARNPDIILLIKPHPHELRPEIALDLIGGFSDLIKTELPPNVRILGHREINTHAIAAHLDMAILYNGSSSLELTALGVPVLMASHFGRHDYPIKLLYPTNRDHYDRFISSRRYRKPTKELRKRAAFLISYLGTPDISTRNTYSRRQVTNDKVGFPVWREDEIANLVEHGDPAMDSIASQITAKFRLNNEKSQSR